jgi:hypothetical protein
VASRGDRADDRPAGTRRSCGSCEELSAIHVVRARERARTVRAPYAIDVIGGAFVAIQTATAIAVQRPGVPWQ